MVFLAHIKCSKNPYKKYTIAPFNVSSVITGQISSLSCIYLPGFDLSLRQAVVWKITINNFSTFSPFWHKQAFVYSDFLNEEYYS